MGLLGWLRGRRREVARPPAPEPIDATPFPKLRWDEGQWAGRAVLPAWAGFQDRRGASAGLSSDRASDGTVRLRGAVPDEHNPTPPSAEQAAAFQYHLENGEQVRDAILSAVFTAHQEWWREAEEVAARPRTMPVVPRPSGTHPSALKELIGIGTLYVLTTARDGFACAGFGFGCDWDEEHGFGVLTHRDRVIEVGEAEIAWAGDLGWEEVEGRGD